MILYNGDVSLTMIVVRSGFDWELVKMPSRGLHHRSALNAVKYGKGGSTILWEEEKIQLKWDWDQMNRGENEGVVKITVKSVSLSPHPPTDPCKCLLYS